MNDGGAGQVFFGKLGQSEVLCGPLMLGGIFFTSAAIGTYIVFNEKLGLYYNSSPWAYGTAAACVIVAALQIPTWASIARKLYAVGCPSTPRSLTGPPSHNCHSSAFMRRDSPRTWQLKRFKRAI